VATLTAGVYSPTGNIFGQEAEHVGNYIPS
jgi:hypothetical protein